MDQRKFAISQLIVHSMLLLSMSLLLISTAHTSPIFTVFFGAAAVFWVAFISRDIKQLHALGRK